MTTATDTATEFLAFCEGAALVPSVNDRDIVTVTKENIPGDRNMYMDAERDALTALYLLPQTSGSIWGTDSGSVGGHIALNDGHFRLNKSGVQKRVLTSLRNMIAAR